MSLLALGAAFAALAAQSPESARAISPPDDPAAVVRAATLAVEGDSVASLRGRWEARREADSLDRAPRLGLATLARLTYDYPTATEHHPARDRARRAAAPSAVRRASARRRTAGGGALRHRAGAVRRRPAGALAPRAGLGDGRAAGPDPRPRRSPVRRRKPEPGGRGGGVCRRVRHGGRAAATAGVRAGGSPGGALRRLAEVRLRDGASEAWLERAPLGEFRVLHFATHAVVDDRSVARTAVALTPGGQEDGFVAPADLATFSLRAGLVVLSACRTAGGVLVAGEGVQGLTAPLLQAGARSVVATRWRIADQRAIRMIEPFYDALAAGLPVGDALRSAKLAALRRGAPTAEWAAFTAVGDPLVRIPLRRRASSWWAWVAGLGGAGAAALLGGLIFSRRSLKGGSGRARA